MKMIEDVDSLDIQSHLRIEDLWTPITYLKHQTSGDDWRILDVLGFKKKYIHTYIYIHLFIYIHLYYMEISSLS